MGSGFKAILRSLETFISLTMALYWFLIALMSVGVIGAVIPGIPGTSLILVAILIWGGVQGFGAVGVPLVVALVILALSIGIDFLATVWGAQRAGASKWGQWGAIIGLIVGFLGLLPALPIGGPLLGIFLGPFLGALIGEFLYRKDLRLAAKAALGVVVSSLIGNLIQGVLALVAVVIFIWRTWPVGLSV